MSSPENYDFHKRDIKIKQGNNGTISTIILVIVLVGGLSFVLVALGVGYVAWQFLKQPEHRPVPSPAAAAPPARPGQPPIAPPLPNNQPPGAMPDKQEAQQPAQDLALQSLPSPGPFEVKPPPPLPAHKRLEFTAAGTFRGHTGRVVAVALSPDEHRGLSSGSDNTMRLWDLDSGKELANLNVNTNAVLGVAFTPDGKQAVSANLDGTLRLWDLEKKTSIRTFEGHAGCALCVTVTPDGQKLLSGGNDRALRIWDVATGKQLHEWYGHDGDVTCVSVSPDGARALTGSSDGGATYWDLRSGRQLAYLSVGSPVAFALFTTNGQRAIVGGDAPARLCDLSTDEQWPESPPADQPARAAALIPGDNVFLQAAGKRLQGRFLPMRRVDPGILRDPRWNLIGEVEAHNSTVTSVCTSRNGRLALTGGEDGVVKLWRIREHDGAEAR